MRTFITYVLAALAIAALFSIPAIFLGVIVGVENSGDERAIILLWAISQTWWIAGIAFVVAIAVMGPAWIFWERWATKNFAETFVANPIVGSVSIAIMFAMIALVARGFIWWGDFQHNPAGEAGFYFASAILAGLTWGTVFWLRQPKHSQSMEAAA